MGIEESILERLRTLPAEKQREVLRFVESLQQKSPTKHPRRSLKGLWTDLEVDITEEDITEARREMWGGFAGKDI